MEVLRFTYMAVERERWYGTSKAGANTCMRPCTLSTRIAVYLMPSPF